MESEWDWKNKRNLLRRKIKLRKEELRYGIWKIWWKLCTTRIKRKIR